MTAVQYPVAHVPMFGKGSLMFDAFDLTTGLATGLAHLGNVPKFGLDSKDDKAELFQYINKVPSKIASAVKKREVTTKIEGTDFNADHLAFAAMSAGKTSLAVSAATVTAEVLVSAAQAANAKGRYFRTLFMNMDNATVLPALTQNAIVLTVNTDYQVVDAKTGLIYFPLTSGIDTTHQITITYNKLVGSFSQIAGSTVPFVQGKLVFFPDPTDGQKLMVEIWRINLSASGELGLIADDYGKWSMDGDVLDDTANHPAAPFYQITLL